MKKFLVALSSAAVALAAAAASAEEPKRGGTLTFSYRIIAGHFNPAIASGTPTGIPGTQLFAALLRFDDQWNPKPYLAESWDISDDGLKVTVKLRSNARFHDGKPITSEDVKFSIETYQQHHPFKPMYAPVKSIDTPDPLTAVFNLSNPHPAILLAFSSQLGVVIPKHVYGNTDNIRQHPQNSQDVVGSGPFKLKEFKPGEYIIMERNEDYFLEGKPYIDRIVYKKIAENTSRVIALEKGDVDLTAFESDAPVLDRLKKNEHLTLTPDGYSAIGPLEWLAFNTKRKPFDDKRVRQAIAYAIDKEFILKVLYGGYAQRSLGPIHPGSVFAPKDVNPYDYDVEKAKALLDEAGYKPDADGIRIRTTLDYIPAGGTWKRKTEVRQGAAQEGRHRRDHQGFGGLPGLDQDRLQPRVRHDDGLGLQLGRPGDRRAPHLPVHEHPPGRAVAQHPAVPERRGRCGHGKGGQGAGPRQARRALRGDAEDGRR